MQHSGAESVMALALAPFLRPPAFPVLKSTIHALNVLKGADSLALIFDDNDENSSGPGIQYHSFINRRSHFKILEYF
jgi:hypothetical protein